MLLGYGAYQHFSQRPIVHGDGIIAHLQPVQQPFQESTNQTNFELNGYTITPLQSFEIEARVLATKNYSLGREADLSPVDLVLGWGKMSDEAVLKEIRISQSGRFYYWHVEQFPIPRQEIETHSANMHMIPANSQLEKLLKSVREGQIVNIKGLLIEARATDGWRWKSSLTRNDTGAGACELVYIEKLVIS